MVGWRGLLIDCVRRRGWLIVIVTEHDTRREGGVQFTTKMGRFVERARGWVGGGGLPRMLQAEKNPIREKTAEGLQKVEMAVPFRSDVVCRGRRQPVGSSVGRSIDRSYLQDSSFVVEKEIEREKSPKKRKQPQKQSKSPKNEGVHPIKKSKSEGSKVSSRGGK